MKKTYKKPELMAVELPEDLLQTVDVSSEPDDEDIRSKQNDFTDEEDSDPAGQSGNIWDE